MKEIRILTDIKILQSQIWIKKTDHVESIDPLLTKVINKLPDRLRAYVNPAFYFVLFIKHMRRYDVIITSNIKTAQLVALYKRVFKIRYPYQIILELMLDEELESIRWKIKRFIQRFVFSSVDAIFVSSRSEIESYSKRLNIDKTRILFLPFHTDILEPRIIYTPKSYVLSAGKTGRDYQTFVEAVKDLPIKVVVISDHQSAKGICLPNNTRLLIDVSYHEYLDLLEKCWFVVVPLKKLVKSTGQVVVLEGMALGKPVIATDTVGTRDYIQSGYTGILVPPRDAVSLRHAICELSNNESMQRAISMNALKFIKENCTFDIYVRRILHVAEYITKYNSAQIDRYAYSCSNEQDP